MQSIKYMLPTDIYTLIYNYTHDPATFINLMRTSKQLYGIGDIIICNKLKSDPTLKHGTYRNKEDLSKKVTKYNKWIEKYNNDCYNHNSRYRDHRKLNRDQQHDGDCCKVRNPRKKERENNLPYTDTRYFLGKNMGSRHMNYNLHKYLNVPAKKKQTKAYIYPTESIRTSSSVVTSSFKINRSCMNPAFLPKN